MSGVVRACLHVVMHVVMTQELHASHVAVNIDMHNLLIQMCSYLANTQVDMTFIYDVHARMHACMINLDYALGLSRFSSCASILYYIFKTIQIKSKLIL